MVKNLLFFLNFPEKTFFLHSLFRSKKENLYIAYETTRTMIKNKIIKPTEGELEILAVLWDKEEASVRTVFEELNKTKESVYTTTLKLMQIMLEKKFVTRDSSVKIHVYKPAITREKTQKQFLGKMISGLFSGSSTQLVLQALGDHQPGKEELEEIELLIKNLKAGK